MSTTIHEINDQTFETEVLKSTEPVLVDFWAPWCGPCKMLAPKLETLSQDHTNIKFVKLNVDDNQDTAAQFGIQGIPALLLFKDGKKIDQMVGNQSIDAIKEFLQQTA